MHSVITQLLFKCRLPIKPSTVIGRGGRVKPGAEEEVGQVEEASSVFGVENRRFKQVVELLVEVWEISEEGQ